MESVVQLWSDWEIQLLMLLSFALQMLLFFTGGLRRCSTNVLLMFYLWIAYLGADMVALYALGYLSRHQDVIIGGSTLKEVHPLSFLWAPFLLMHLGGQDTITAFTIEDNNLWLRHLLNLGLQVALTLYVFWKSMDRHNLHILIPGIFLFVAGIIKYGERTLALMHGNLKNIRGSIRSEDKASFPKVDEDEVDYFGLVSFVLHSAPGIRELLPCTRWNRIIGNSYGPSTNEQRWPNLGPLKKLLENSGMGFGYGIVCFHIFTEAHLRKYFNQLGVGTIDAKIIGVLVGMCQKLSNYMFYLLVTHPEMLPVSGTTQPILAVLLGDVGEQYDFFFTGVPLPPRMIPRGGDVLFRPINYGKSGLQRMEVRMPPEDIANLFGKKK
uniref:DUF4220 domain-containing protein n=1 Tax=Oryza meridionalis TaxID=40149 RepID=A0A0E0F0H9_9ORYZ